MTVVPVTSADLDAAEVSWFSALCSDDYAYLGVPDGSLRSSFEHCSDIVKKPKNLASATFSALRPIRSGRIR